MPPLLNDANKVYVGGTQASAVYVGTTKVWPSLPPVFFIEPLGSSPTTYLGSPDGVNWSPVTTSSVGTSYLLDGAYSSTLGFLAVHGTGSFKSADGETWSSFAAPFAGRAVEWCSGLGKFIVIGQSGSGNNAYLTDLTTTTGSKPNSRPGMSVAYSPSLGRIVATFSFGEAARSDNGTTWTAVTTGLAGEIRAVCWGGNNVSRFVAANGAGALATSSDGITWTARTSSFGSTPINGIAWSPPLQMFVAVGDSGSLASSPDGINWTQRTSTFGTSAIQAVRWSRSAGVFLAVGLTGKAAVSSDGINWTSVTTGTSGNLLGLVVKDPSGDPPP